VIDGKVVLAGGAAAAVADQTKTAPAVIASEVRICLLFTGILSWAYRLKTGKRKPGVRIRCEETVSFHAAADAWESTRPG
jgi:hypothetical protein